MYEKVIWATDGSGGADAALHEALRLAERGTHIVAVHCDQRLYGRAGSWPAIADEADVRARIGRQVDELTDQHVDVELVVRRDRRQPADVVAEVAREIEADVIVCGTRGLSAFAGAVLGSFTQRLLHVAPCPVLVVGPRSEQVAATRRLGAETTA
jgi:nucleotide-binding universal stress UspA family protein